MVYDGIDAGVRVMFAFFGLGVLWLIIVQFLIGIMEFVRRVIG